MHLLESILCCNVSFEKAIAENDGRTVMPVASNLLAITREVDLSAMVTTSHLAALP
jgi:hypothetical protein